MALRATRNHIAAAVLLLCATSSLGARRLHAGVSVDSTVCPGRNEQLTSWLDNEVKKGDGILPKHATDFEGFLSELKTVLDQRTLPDRPIHYLLSDTSPFHPTCSGDWMEFGVFNADTLNLAAMAKDIRCGIHCSPLFGFDTFTGLPEEWARGDGANMAKGEFSLGGKLPVVAPNVQLVKGIFADSLPLFEAQHDRHAGNQSVSFLHVDCDLYAGTRDIFHHLSGRVHEGTVIVFDELVNYNKYREGEVKALWEWLQATGAKLATIGMLGPIEGKNYNMDLHTNEADGEHPWFHQSVAFVVATEPRPESLPEVRQRGPILLDAEVAKQHAQLHVQVQSQKEGHNHQHDHEHDHERKHRSAFEQGN